MPRTYSSVVNPVATPQRQPVFGREAELVRMESGGYAFEADKWHRAERFLILGNEGGSYYAGEAKMTESNARAILACLKEDGPRLVSLLAAISNAGRNVKQEPVLYALALAYALGDTATRQLIRSTPADVGHVMHVGQTPPSPFRQIVRTGYQLFQFMAYLQEARGGKKGAVLRKLVTPWYLDRPVRDLAYQLVKYQSRTQGKAGDDKALDNHRDILRTIRPLAYAAEPAPSDDSLSRNAAFRWAVHGLAPAGEKEQPPAQAAAAGLLERLSKPELAPIHGFEQAKLATSEETIVSLIRQYRLTWEMLPSKWLKSPAVWGTLLESMPLGAMLRMLGRLSSLGVIDPLSGHPIVLSALRDRGMLQRSRLHPLAVLQALSVYKSGRGVRGSMTWTPCPGVVDALNDAFYACFQNVEPSGKRVHLSIDISGSMHSGTVAGFGQMDCSGVAAALALITMAVEPASYLSCFGTRFHIVTGITSRTRLSELDAAVRQFNEGTDCSVPITGMLTEGWGVDAMVLFTDSQSWAGNQHTFQAMEAYRRAKNPDAKLVIVNLVANAYALGDPQNPRDLLVVGCDTAAPKVIADFIRH